MRSTFLTLKTRDFLKGLIMGVGTPLLYLLQELIPGWNIPPLAKAAISATVTYLLKNLVTDDVKQSLKVLEEEKIISSSNAKKLETFKTAAPKDEELNK